MLEFLINKVAGLKPAKLLKKRLQHRFFPLNIAEFLRHYLQTDTYGSKTEFVQNLEIVQS